MHLITFNKIIMKLFVYYLPSSAFLICVVFLDCVTDVIIICGHVLWNSSHFRRVQRHGCFIRAQKQVSTHRCNFMSVYQPYVYTDER